MSPKVSPEVRKRKLYPQLEIYVKNANSDQVQIEINQAIYWKS